MNGWSLPPDVPLWAGLVFLCLIYAAIGMPLHATRRASYYALGGPVSGQFAAWDGVLGAGISILIVWYSYNHVPEVRDIIRDLPLIWHRLADSVRT